MSSSVEKEIDLLIGGNDEAATVNMWLDTGLPELNKALSGSYDGGMPAGRIVEMFGPESSGKTAIATKVMAAAQKAGGIPMFLDHEHSFDMNHAEQMGLDTTPGKFIYKTPDTFEQSLTMAVKVAEHVREKKLISDDSPLVMVFDSLASMVPQSKLDKSAEDYNMNDNTALARATSAAFPALVKFAERNNALMLFLNQKRTKIGVMFGDPTTTPGGDSPKFYASIRINLGRQMISKDVKGVKGKVKVGQTITADCIKNKVSRPFQKATWDFIFDDGNGRGYFDAIGSTLEHLKDIGAIEKSGNFYLWSDGKKYAKKSLTEKIESEGLWDELVAMLPK